MPWIDKVPAVLQLWYDSQEQGNALADILFGDENPSGKLPTTFPVRLEDNPAYINYPGENGKVRYGEGIFVGYRYYDKKEVDAALPIRSWTFLHQIQIQQPELERKILTPNETLKVKVDVTNTGKVTGKEIVQLYVRDVNPHLPDPKRNSKPSRKMELRAQANENGHLHVGP